MPEVEKTGIDAEAINRFMHMMENGIKTGSDFVMEQAPQVIQELIAWQRFWHTLTLAAVAIGCVSLIIFARRLYKKLSTDDEAWDNPSFSNVGIILSCIAALVLGIYTPFAAYYASMVWFAPRLYVIEYISNLVHK